ncbi:uncharacterized protein J3D65DRAFT_602031 [Phyllosticta citribraziliensis]|uniref:Ubiquitin-like protease family profile domain-containing protein n=1 Tax=Phyllosticta citribraziliensis TaxID=989973 RepID=A0ABR1LXZ4_9PEZI
MSSNRNVIQELPAEVRAHMQRAAAALNQGAVMAEDAQVQEAFRAFLVNFGALEKKPEVLNTKSDALKTKPDALNTKPEAREQESEKPRRGPLTRHSKLNAASSKLGKPKVTTTTSAVHTLAPPASVPRGRRPSRQPSPAAVPRGRRPSRQPSPAAVPRGRRPSRQSSPANSSRAPSWSPSQPQPPDPPALPAAYANNAEYGRMAQDIAKEAAKVVTSASTNFAKLQDLRTALGAQFPDAKFSDLISLRAQRLLEAAERTPVARRPGPDKSRKNRQRCCDSWGITHTELDDYFPRENCGQTFMQKLAVFAKKNCRSFTDAKNFLGAAQQERLTGHILGTSKTRQWQPQDVDMAAKKAGTLPHIDKEEYGLNGGGNVERQDDEEKDEEEVEKNDEHVKDNEDADNINDNEGGCTPARLREGTITSMSPEHGRDAPSPLPEFEYMEDLAGFASPDSSVAGDGVPSPGGYRLRFSPQISPKKRVRSPSPDIFTTKVSMGRRRSKLKARLDSTSNGVAPKPFLDLVAQHDTDAAGVNDDQDGVINPGPLDCLKDGSRLNDVAMAQALALLTCHDRSIMVVDSLLPNDAPSLGESATVVHSFFHGKHWTLLLVDRPRKHVAFFDSLPTSSPELRDAIEAHVFNKLLHDERRDEWGLSACLAPRQSNAIDCGVHVLAILAYNVTGIPLPITLNPPVWRAVLSLLLLGYLVEEPPFHALLPLTSTKRTCRDAAADRATLVKDLASVVSVRQDAQNLHRVVTSLVDKAATGSGALQEEIEDNAKVIEAYKTILGLQQTTPGSDDCSQALDKQYRDRRSRGWRCDARLCAMKKLEKNGPGAVQYCEDVVAKAIAQERSLRQQLPN